MPPICAGVTAGMLRTKERGGSAPGKGIDLTVADFFERLRLPGATISVGIFTGFGDPGLAVAAGGDLRCDRYPLF